ncbi:MAG: leucine-rich repeat domain-containing protein [Bacteroidota bacterium]
MMPSKPSGYTKAWYRKFFRKKADSVWRVLAKQDASSLSFKLKDLIPETAVPLNRRDRRDGIIVHGIIAYLAVYRRKMVKNLQIRNGSLDQVTLIIRLPSSLRVLDLSDNQLQFLPYRFDQLQNLQELNLSYNRFPCIPSGLWLSNLILLDLSYNKINEVDKNDANTFCETPKLAWLNLSNNRLKTEPISLTKILNLQYLNLARNKIHTLPARLATMDSLQLLDVSQNPLVQHFTESPSRFYQLGNLRKASRIRYGASNVSVPLSKEVCIYFRQGQEQADVN